MEKNIIAAQAKAMCTLAVSSENGKKNASTPVTTSANTIKIKLKFTNVRFKIGYAFLFLG
ncbi:hypothetical protein GCM10007852_07230 [Agaribacter marinus]|uniref:Uncharacterized protein n=1 Tax=Agaribacter marinus TaxID=1431249 RepID=A0AA37WJH9_9ALTE|nr:hypothetical protein GCM10007852_07230 [Agaribacter marinus]